MYKVQVISSPLLGAQLRHIQKYKIPIYLAMVSEESNFPTPRTIIINKCGGIE